LSTLITISLTPALAEHVETLAGRQGVTAAAWITRWLEDHAGLSRPSPWAKPSLVSDALPEKDRKSRIAEQAAALAQLGTVSPSRNRKQKHYRSHNDDWN